MYENAAALQSAHSSFSANSNLNHAVIPQYLCLSNLALQYVRDP